MNEFGALLVSSSAGIITGLIQFSIFKRSPTQVKSFLSHLDDLRRFVMMAIAVLAIVTLLLAMPANRIDLLKWVFGGFVLSWIGIVLLCARAENKSNV